MARRCKRCNTPIGGLFSRGRVKESDEKGICVNCYDKAKEKESKREKRKKDKLRKAWLYKR